MAECYEMQDLSNPLIDHLYEDVEGTLKISGLKPVEILYLKDETFGQRMEVQTPYGVVTVHKKGKPTKPTIITFHDIGLNSHINFGTFVKVPEMKSLLRHFMVIYIDAIGMEPGAKSICLNSTVTYPTIDQFTEIIECVRKYFSLEYFIGMGVGLGANILARYATKYPQFTAPMMLINCTSTGPTWAEWFYQNKNLNQLKYGSMTGDVVNYLVWHYFGSSPKVSPTLMNKYKEHLLSDCNPINLCFLIKSYYQRKDLGITRDKNQILVAKVPSIKCPVLNITGNYGAHVKSTVEFNGRIDPSLTTWMKIQDCGMVLEEKPGKAAEAFRLFLQGQGFYVGDSRKRYV